jgi:hypothetical protein
MCESSCIALAKDEQLSERLVLIDKLLVLYTMAAIRSEYAFH